MTITSERYQEIQKTTGEEIDLDSNDRKKYPKCLAVKYKCLLFRMYH